MRPTSRVEWIKLFDPAQDKFDDTNQDRADLTLYNLSRQLHYKKRVAKSVRQKLIV